MQELKEISEEPTTESHSHHHPTHTHTTSTLIQPSSSIASQSQAQSIIDAPLPSSATTNIPKMSKKAREMMHGKSLREQRPLELVAMLKTNVGYRFMLCFLYREYAEENLLAFKVSGVDARTNTMM
jgi:hypothetical protein